MNVITNGMEYWEVYDKTCKELNNYCNENKKEWEVITKNGNKEQKIRMALKIEDDFNKILAPLTNGISVSFTKDFIKKVLNEEV